MDMTAYICHLGYCDISDKLKVKLNKLIYCIISECCSLKKIKRSMRNLIKSDEAYSIFNYFYSDHSLRKQSVLKLNS